MLYLLIRYIIRYRLKVVKENVKNAFPKKTEKERDLIINNFYKHFCNQSIESLYFLFITQKAIKKRFIFENINLLNDIAKNGKNITVVLGHYGNWDWLASIPLWTEEIISATLYKKIKNKTFNKIFLKIRTKFGTRCIEKSQALRGIIELNKENKHNVIAYLADQTPSARNIHYWVNFLNQPTPVLSGWATIARKFDTPVVYTLIKPTSKGHYIVKLDVITYNPKEMTEIELIKGFMSRLEKDIMIAPEYWLWSHKRWKYNKPDNIQIQ